MYLPGPGEDKNQTTLENTKVPEGQYLMQYTHVHELLADPKVQRAISAGFSHAIEHGPEGLRFGVRQV